MEAIAPHVAAIAQNGKLGKLKDLTDKQFQIYQLLKTSLSYKQIARVLNITPSGVEKAFEVIKRKIGVNNKKELSYVFKKA
jgi:DNA-binding CsgD family transcriptional regulator